MQLHKVFKKLLFVLLAFICLPNITNASNNNTRLKTTTNTVKMEKAHADSLITRLEAINSLDKNLISKTERKHLRTEVKAINKELVRGSGGIYLSVGAVLLVILLLIILL